MKMIQIEKGSILPKPDDSLILEKEKYFRIKFPNSYIDFVKQYNGGIPIEHLLSINGNDYFAERFLCILGDKESYDAGWFDIGVVTSGEIGERLAIDENEIGLQIIPILQLVGKDYICLDFRNNKLEPEVCIWYNSKSEYCKPFTNKISNNFEEFLSILDIRNY